MGLAVAQRVLARPELAALELFSFRAYGSRKRLVIRLDKVSRDAGTGCRGRVTFYVQDHSGSRAAQCSNGMLCRRRLENSEGCKAF